MVASAAPRSLVDRPGSTVQYWVGSATVEGNRLRVLYNLLQPQGDQALDVEPVGTALATFSLPDLTLVDLHTLPLSTGTAWGSSILTDGDYTYVYGSEHNGSGPKYAHVARVPRNRISGPWQFWTGHAWSSREADSARLLTGVGTAYSVVRVDGAYLLVTVDTNLTFNQTIVAYPGSSPTGPFGPPTVLLEAPEAGAGGRPIIAYDATVHPELTGPATFVLSYNVNSLNPADDLADVSIYRPRFVDVTWPPPAGDTSGSPPGVSGVTATLTADGVVHLGWPAAGPGHTYRVYERDRTFGQTFFARIPATLATNRADLPYLRDGHEYDFEVSTVDEDGAEGPPGPMATVRVAVPFPSPPTGVAATPDGTGQVALRWTPAPGSVWYAVYQRDLSAGEVNFHRVDVTNTTSTAVSVGPLVQGHVYQFGVTAANGRGESTLSTVVQAVAHIVAPPAPTSLRVTAHPDGRVSLAWAMPAAGTGEAALFGPLVNPPTLTLPRTTQLGGGATPTTFTVYQRDLTTGAPSFTALDGVAGDQVDLGTLLSGHTYQLTVGAVNAAGSGPLAAPVQVRVTGGLPTAPTALTASAGDSSITLSWMPPGPDAFYLVYRRDLSAGEADYTRLAGLLDTTAMSDGSVVNGHQYLYQVSAVTVHGEGPRTPPVAVRPLPPVPGAPTGLTAVPGNGTVTLSWTAPGPGPYYYLIDRRDVTRGEQFRRFPLPDTTGSPFQDADLVNGDTYEYRVTATNLAGTGPPSTVVSVRPGG